MLIIPEIETVVILPPRTGSGSLYCTVLEHYPKAFMPYRHMEADGVPFGYDRWRRVGVLRDPLARMWSLYNFLKRMGLDSCTDRPQHSQYHAQMRNTVAEVDFETWLMQGQEIFTCHQDRYGDGKTHPEYAVLHAFPEQKKSQFTYLRPDLGVEIVPYSPGGQNIAAALKLDDVPTVANMTNCSLPPPLLEGPVALHMLKYHKWDFEMCATLDVCCA